MGTRSDSIANAFWFLFTRRHLLEGRYSPRRRRYRNWDRSVEVEPNAFQQPSTEAQIRVAVRTSARVGTVGAGHSFNDLHLRRSTLLSLDRYAGLIRIDPATHSVVFRAGTRLRDAAAILKERQLALPLLPDHNAQSLAGVIATDVHASGQPGRPAHVSEAVNYLRIIDADGVAHDARPGDPLFRATVGGMGCTGVIVEVGFTCTAPFRLKTSAFRCSFDELLENLETWRAQNELLAAGYFPHIDACVVEIKNRTDEPLTPLGPLRETVRHVLQAVMQTVCLPWARREQGVRRAVGRFVLEKSTRMLREYSDLVLDNFEGFNRNVYQVHSEAEFTVPLEQAREVLKEGRALMQQHPESAHYLLGIRMSQANPNTLIGPGTGPAGAQLAWIAPHLDGHRRDPQDDARWGALCRRFHGRPHYGKALLGLDAAYLAREYGRAWTQFRAQLRQLDPTGKFANALSAESAQPSAYEPASAAEAEPADHGLTLTPAVIEAADGSWDSALALASAAEIPEAGSAR
jgi:FAD/FMN-containing dehydrogenase